MKYYEFNRLDYYALVRAVSREDATQEYIRSVAYEQSDYDEVYHACVELKSDVAIDKIKSKGTDKEFKELMESDLKVLLIDGSLL